MTVCATTEICKGEMLKIYTIRKGKKRWQIVKESEKGGGLENKDL